MSEVKRYDAVHIRYEESNIRYGEGCEVEVVAAYDYDALNIVNAALLEALELADAALSGANMNMKVVERKVKDAIAKVRCDA